MGVGVGRMLAWLAFLSLIAFAAYQFPAEDTFAHLRSWYPLGQSEGSQVTATAVNKDPYTLNHTKVYLQFLCFLFLSSFCSM